MPSKGSREDSPPGGGKSEETEADRERDGDREENTTTQTTGLDSWNDFFRYYALSAASRNVVS